MFLFVAVLEISAVGLLLQPSWAFPEKDQLSVEIQEPKVEDVAYVPEDSKALPEIGNNASLSELKNGEEIEPQGKVSYAGNQLWKVAVETAAKKKVVALLRERKDISMWGGNATTLDILVKPQSLGNVSKQLLANDISYEVIIQDLQTAINEENPPPEDDVEGLQDRTGHRLTWQSYHRLADIYGYLDYLTTSFPRLCSLRVIGNSVEGRPLKVLKISNGNPGNKAVWLDGGIHAREWISPATVTFIINYLVENYEREPQAVQNIDWHILSVANPDGYEFSHTTDRLWRKNRARRGQCAGTDLNRNFGYRWGGKGSGKNPCQETYGGAGPFSEPETSAIRNYITGLAGGAAWRAYISFHSYGQYILYPWGYDNVVPPDHHELQALGDKAAAAMRSVGGGYYRVGSAANMLYAASGGSDDWAKGTVGMKYAYTIELRDSGRYGFLLPASYINPTAKEALAAIKVIAGAIAIIIVNGSHLPMHEQPKYYHGLGIALERFEELLQL